MVTAVAALFATSCTKQIEPQPAPALTGQQVYFSVDQVTKFVVGKNIEDKGASSVVEIPIYRMATDSEYTAELRFGVAEGYEDFEATCNKPVFKVGETESKVVVSFDADQLDLGEEAQFIISIREEASPYGQGAEELTFTISKPEPWVVIEGEGYYIDDFFCPLLGYDSGYAAPMVFEQYADNPKLIRVVEPLGIGFFQYMFGDVPAFIKHNTEPAYFTFDVTDPANVIFVENPCTTGLSLNFTDIGLSEIYAYVPKNEDGSQVAGAITYEGGAILIAKEMIYICNEYEGKLSVMAPTNTSGSMAYVLPGADLSDYTFAAEYTGMIVPANSSEPIAVVEFELGADLSTYKFVVLPDKVTEADDTIEAIVAGTAEDVIEGDDETLEMELVGLTTGMHTIVGVAFNEEGEAKADLVYSFYFAGLGDAELPEVEVTIELGSVAEMTGNPAHEEKYPSSTVMAVYIGTEDYSQLTGLRYFVRDAAEVHAAIASGEDTIESIVESAGEDGGDWIETFAGGSIVLFNKMTPGAEYCAIFAIDTIYGQTQYYEVDYTMPTAGETPDPEPTPDPTPDPDATVEASFVFNSVAGIMQNPAYEEQYPASNYLACYMDVDDPKLITGMRVLVTDRTEIHTIIDGGESTFEELIDAEGYDVYEWIETIEQGNVRIMTVEPGTELCCGIAIDTVYDTTQYYHSEYDVPGTASASAMPFYANFSAANSVVLNR